MVFAVHVGSSKNMTQLLHSVFIIFAATTTTYILLSTIPPVHCGEYDPVINCTDGCSASGAKDHLLCKDQSTPIKTGTGIRECARPPVRRPWDWDSPWDSPHDEYWTTISKQFRCPVECICILGNRHVNMTCPERTATLQILYPSSI